MCVLATMGMNNGSLFLFIFLAGLLCLVWGVSALLSRKKFKMTSRATVQSHRVWRDSSWTYLVCFSLCDGSSLELRTTKGDYQSLSDGQTGQLTWEDDRFCHFDPDHTP